MAERVPAASDGPSNADKIQRAAAKLNPVGKLPGNLGSRPLPEPTFSLVDRAMIGLAVLSVLFVLVDTIPAIRGRLTPEQYWTIVYADLLITAIFAIEFTASAIKSKSFAGYAKANWYDLVGMIPMYAFVMLEAGAFGFIRGLRFLRIVRIFVVGSRFMRATNMTFGEQVVERIFQRYQGIIVQMLATPLLLQALTVTQRTAIRMRYLEAVGHSLDSKRAEVHAAIVETLEKNRVPESVISSPMVAKMIREIEDQIMDHLVATLTAEKLNVLIQELIVTTLEDVKVQLKSPEGKASVVHGQDRIDAILKKRDEEQGQKKAPVTEPRMR